MSEERGEYEATTKAGTEVRAELRLFDVRPGAVDPLLRAIEAMLTDICHGSAGFSLRRERKEYMTRPEDTCLDDTPNEQGEAGKRAAAVINLSEEIVGRGIKTLYRDDRRVRDNMSALGVCGQRSLWDDFVDAVYDLHGVRGDRDGA